MSKSPPRLNLAIRRGMLELDLLFKSYHMKRYHSADKQEKECFHALLRENDQDLYDWLIKNKSCPEHHHIIKIILTVHNE